MICPDDGSDLREEAQGVHACRSCRGRAILRDGFAAAQPVVHALLEPEQDRASGAFAHERGCPSCDRTMTPLRVGDQRCWLEWCPACGLLWIEKLDTYVVERLEKRIPLERAVHGIPAAERAAMASDMAHELERDGRLVRFLRRLRWALRWLTHP
jgi:hypothetical protein